MWRHCVTSIGFQKPKKFNVLHPRTFNVFIAKMNHLSKNCWTVRIGSKSFRAMWLTAGYNFMIFIKSVVHNHDIFIATQWILYIDLTAAVINVFVSNSLWLRLIYEWKESKWFEFTYQLIILNSVVLNWSIFRRYFNWSVYWTVILTNLVGFVGSVT